MSAIADVSSLEAVVGSRPATHHLKSIADLDEHCEAILAASPAAVVGAVATDGSLRTTVVGGEPGALTVPDPSRLALPDGAGRDLPDGTPTALLAVVPGYGETLRVNGRLRHGAVPHVEVEEAFLHCAKAVIRSRLWAEPPAAGPATVLDDGATGVSDPAVRAFLARSPFVLLTSVDADGCADVSPKGDPAGFVQVLDDATVALPDRPGNRRTDTLHNLLSDARLGLLALVPGEHRVLEVRGRARVSDDPALRAGMEVGGKVPKAAVVLTVDHVELRTEPGLAAARLWDPSRHVEAGTLPKATRVWVDHVKRNDDPGLVAKAARAATNERMLHAGIEHDYRSNLY